MKGKRGVVLRKGQWKAEEYVSAVNPFKEVWPQETQAPFDPNATCRDQRAVLSSLGKQA